MTLVCAEVLAILLRQNHNNQGITIGSGSHKVLQYADDTVIILDGSTLSLKSTLNLLDQFYKFSGLKPNLEKTECVWIGSMRFSNRCLFPEKKLTWKNSFTTLGIKFSTNLSEIISLNYEVKIKEIENNLASWEKRENNCGEIVHVVQTCPSIYFFTIPSKSHYS